MTTNVQEPSSLPVSAIPDGCAAWNGEHARVWADAAVPWWVPVRPRRWAVELAVWCALLVAPALLTTTDLPPELIALLPLQVVWWLWRPELVRFAAPVLVVVVAVRWSELSWPVRVCAALLVLAPVTATELRARARAGQRRSALAATDGVTAPLPDVDGPVRRGGLFLRFGAVVAVPGVVLLATSGLWADDRREAVAIGLFLAGLALTLLLSGALGRHRALALRKAPAPVLRVLVGKDDHEDTVVYGTDDTAALRPLFTVATRAAVDDEADEEEDLEEIEELLDAPPKSGEHTPLREAVLYGTPADGAEILLVGAAEEAGEPPVTQWSTGPVRPLAAGAARRRTAREARAAVRAARNKARDEELAATVRAGITVVPVRRWRAGPVDWLGGFLTVLWGCSVFAVMDDPGYWMGTLVLLCGLMGATLVPRKLRWRITADRTGLWLNQLRGPRHVPWDDLRSARREAFELQLRVRDGDHWDLSAPRWPWLQRRRGLIHPYDAIAAELSAMIADPALRPTGESGEKERGRPLWPFAVVLCTAWIALLVTRWLS
ncbi:hypothetical protein JHN63_41700 [Streptomyces sp. MBT65]|uniref:hypothetical protein n=1 Tax=Streptomyces sp. MBT65 TaxID=1488395 RepID=UPI0019095480|nr:hypothetical protein [Streptomyces sp. MBT65]MBK3580196.1 hypothetical protein [Streptomyces sp. MBT65]